MEDLFVKRMCGKYNRSEQFIKLLLKICEDNCILNKEEIIDGVCQKVCQTKEHNTRRHTAKQDLKNGAN